MTNTSFHRRTLSDIFSHGGAARLSVLMDEESQRSPRSENASVPFSASMEMDCRLVSECVNSTGYDDDDDDDVDEDEGVIAMGLDCLDCDNDLNFVDVSEVAENQTIFYPHYDSVMSCNQDTRDDMDSYIDSDESASVLGNKVHMNRNGSTAAAAATVMTYQLQCHPPPTRHTANTASPAFADHHRRQNFQNLLEATDNQCGVGVKGSVEHHEDEGVMDCNIQEKEQSMEEANRDLETLQGSSGQGQAACQHRQQQQQHLVSMSSSACQDDPKQPHSNSCGHSRDMQHTSACMCNGSACVSSRTGAGSDLSSISISPLAVTVSPSYDGRQTGTFLESESILFQTRGQLICSEQISQPSAVPVPPPASCRPSTASSSASSSSASPGMLAGLRNFRLQWGGGAGTGAGHSSGQTLAAHSDNKGTSPSSSTPVAHLNMAVSAAPGEFSGILPGTRSFHSDR